MWACVCGHVCVDMCVWTYVCGHVCMGMCVWTCVYGHVCMDMCVWTCAWTGVCVDITDGLLTGSFGLSFAGTLARIYRGAGSDPAHDMRSIFCTFSSKNCTNPIETSICRAKNKGDVMSSVSAASVRLSPPPSTVLSLWSSRRLCSV